MINGTPSGEEFTLSLQTAVRELTYALNPQYHPKRIHEHLVTVRLAAGYFANLSRKAQDSLLEFRSNITVAESATLSQGISEIAEILTDLKPREAPLDFTPCSDDPLFSKGEIPEYTEFLMKTFHSVEVDEGANIKALKEREVQSRKIYLFLRATLEHYFTDFIKGFEPKDLESLYKDLENTISAGIFQTPRNSTAEERQAILAASEAVGAFLYDYSQGVVNLENSIEQEDELLLSACKNYLRSLRQTVPELCLLFSFLLHPTFAEMMLDLIKRLINPEVFCVIIDELLIKSPGISIPNDGGHPLTMYDSGDGEFTDRMNLLYKEKFVPALIKLGEGEGCRTIKYGLKRCETLFGTCVQKGLNRIKNSGNVITPFVIAKAVLFSEKEGVLIPKLLNIAQDVERRPRVEKEVNNRLMGFIQEQIKGPQDKKSKSLLRHAASGVFNLAAKLTDADRFSANLSGKLFAITQDQRYIMRLFTYIFNRLAEGAAPPNTNDS